MHVDGIEAALDARRVPSIEMAFFRLVHWADPDSIGEIDVAHDLGRLLDRVTAALEADKLEMPDDLVASILARSGDAMWFRDDRSSAAGARAVASGARHWRAMFTSRLDLDGAPGSGADPRAT